MGLRYPLILLVAAAISACSNGDGETVRCNPEIFNQSSELRLTRMVPGLGFDRPILLLPAPGDDTVFYVLEQAGIVWRVDFGTEARSELVDLRDFYDINNPDSCSECGLLGMAFHPDFESNGYIYLSFTEGSDSTPTSHVARFRSADDGRTLAGAPERMNILTVPQPFPNHKGGHIAFGPDRFLYVGLGDGGSARDPMQNAQDINVLLGKMLRLNDDGTPAAGNDVPGGLPEIYAYGLRNPWRWSFDRETGELWLADVGQDAFEEIDIIVNGGNYGWRCFEGFEPTPGIGACTLNGEPAIEPVAVYGQDEGFSVTGGYVYRGGALPDYRGVYFFGDYGSGMIWGLFPRANNRYERTDLLASGLNISSFGEGNDGELYVVDHRGGIYLIEEGVDAAAGQVPPRLSGTRCVNMNDPAKSVAGTIPYDINEPFWSDGAEKRRYMALPENGRVNINAEGDFVFPIGTALIKHFRVDGRFIETRFFVRDTITTWTGYSYRWNDSQTEATLLSGAEDVAIGGQLWHFPGREECLQCHTAAAGFSLGPEVAQLNKSYPHAPDGTPVNQMDYLRLLGIFADAPPAGVSKLKLVSSADTMQDLGLRARAYLHSNCSNCHRPGGPTQSTMDLRFSTALTEMNICDSPPLLGTPDIAGARLLAPGDPARSVMLARMQAAGANRMPPLSTNVIDTDGVLLIEQWIRSLAECN